MYSYSRRVFSLNLYGKRVDIRVFFKFIAVVCMQIRPSRLIERVGMKNSIGS